MAALRAVVDGIQTDVSIKARDNTQGNSGVFEIDRSEISSGDKQRAGVARLE